MTLSLNRSFRSRHTKRVASFLVFSFVAAGAIGKELSASAHTEIDTLIGVLGASQCEFYRNGTWYEGSKAKEHLASKLDYFVKKGLVSTPEEFIGEAATKSSMSGESYQVRCPGAAAEPSAQWLGDQFKRLKGAETK